MDSPPGNKTKPCRLFVRRFIGVALFVVTDHDQQRRLGKVVSIECLEAEARSSFFG